MPAVTVTDLGDRYVVTAGERSKTYPDPGRDCLERARVAATFIALVLAPDEAAASSAPAPSVPPRPPPPVAVTPPPRPALPPSRHPWLPWLRADARGALELATAEGQVAPGAALRVAAGRGILGGHAVCEWLAGVPTNLTGGAGAGAAQAPGSVLLERFPCAVGPTLRLFPVHERLELDVDVGLAVGVLRASGRGFAMSYGATRPETGVRLAVDGTWLAHAGGFAPVVGLEVTYYPSVYDLDVMPRGVVAETPHLWAGFTGGVCWTSGL
jgi:hypothetical protein